MMRFLKEIFSKDPKILSVEDHSISLNKELFDLIVKTEKLLNELNSYVIDDKVSFKDAKLAEFENALLHIKTKIDSLRLDVQRILDLEIKNKDFILLNDDFYLKDKFSRIETMNQVVEELLSLISERPAIAELREMMSYMRSKIASLVDSVNNIISDDKHLKEVYSRLKDL